MASDVIKAVVKELRVVHGLSEKDAASLAFTVAGVVYMSLREKPLPRCPFRAGKVDIAIDEPCPVCGMLGHFDAEDKCVESRHGQN